MSDPPLLEVRDLSKSYGTTVALQSVDLEVPAGEIVGLLGPNGAGKSTLLRVVCGLLEQDSGQVWVRGELGYVPQRLVVWPDLTCMEQLEFLADLHGIERGRDAALRELRRLGLEERRDDLAATLSGGMKRRLSVALALVHDPTVVLLDEAEVGLDPESRVSFRRTLRQLADDGRGVLLSTHGIAEIESVADRVVILDQGEVIAEGPPRELSAPGDERAIVELDLPESPAAAALLRALEEGFGPSTRVNGRVYLRASDTINGIDAVLRCVREHGVEPERVGVRRPSLEDVFVELTGAEVHTVNATFAVARKALRQQLRDRLGTTLFLFTAPFFVAFYRLVFSADESSVDFDAYVPSLLVFAVIMLVFSSSITVARELERGTLERMRMTPLRPVEYLAGTSIAQALLGTVSIALTFGVAVGLGFDPRGSIALAFVVAAMAGVACIGVGVLVASLSRSVAQAFLIGSAFMFLLVLFSGIVFPLPEFEGVSFLGRDWGPFDLLPTVHAVRGLREVLVEGATLDDLGTNVAALMVLAALFFGAGCWRFSVTARPGARG